MARRRRTETLTPRETDVLRLVAEGLSDTGIAARLGLSANTVHNHLKAVRARTGTHTRDGAAALALLRGWLICE